MTLYLAEEMRLLSHGADLKWLTDSWGGACASRKVFMKSEEFSCELSSVSSFIVTVGLGAMPALQGWWRMRLLLGLSCQLARMEQCGCKFHADSRRGYNFTLWCITTFATILTGKYTMLFRRSLECLGSEDWWATSINYGIVAGLAASLPVLGSWRSAIRCPTLTRRAIGGGCDGVRRGWQI